MAYDNTVTVVGNVTRDPELRFTPGGAPVTNFSVAWNRKDQNDEDVVSFFDITCWRSLAENVAESITKGQRVIVYGRLEPQVGDRRDHPQRVPRRRWRVLGRIGWIGRRTSVHGWRRLPDR